MSGSIVVYRWYETEIDDQREITENKIRNKIMVKTSTRMPWSQLRLIRPIPQWNDEHPNEPKRKTSKRFRRWWFQGCQT